MPAWMVGWSAGTWMVFCAERVRPVKRKIATRAHERERAQGRESDIQTPQLKRGPMEPGTKAAGKKMLCPVQVLCQTKSLLFKRKLRLGSRRKPHVKYVTYS